MSRKNLVSVSAATCVASLLAAVGCSSSGQHASHTEADHNPQYVNTRYTDHNPEMAYRDTRETSTSRDTTYNRDTTTTQAVNSSSLSEWPPNAQAGECYGKAFVPPATQMVSEKVLVQEASERLEIVPAQYEWVEERVLVKDACTQLIEVPAEYRTEQVTVEVSPASTGWKMDSSGRCTTPDGRPVKDVFCLVNTPAQTRTVSQQRLVKAAHTKEVECPAVYETVKRHKMVTPASCKRITIPAEFQTVEKTVVTAPGRWEWQRVICDPENNPITLNRVKEALLANGYTPSAHDGQMSEQDWDAIKAFQIQNGLGVGGLTYETLAKLNVPAE